MEVSVSKPMQRSRRGCQGRLASEVEARATTWRRRWHYVVVREDPRPDRRSGCRRHAAVTFEIHRGSLRRRRGRRAVTYARRRSGTACHRPRYPSPVTCWPTSRSAVERPDGCHAARVATTRPDADADDDHDSSAGPSVPEHTGPCHLRSRPSKDTPDHMTDEDDAP